MRGGRFGGFFFFYLVGGVYFTVEVGVSWRGISYEFFVDGVFVRVPGGKTSRVCFFRLFPFLSLPLKQEGGGRRRRNKQKKGRCGAHPSRVRRKLCNILFRTTLCEHGEEGRRCGMVFECRVSRAWGCRVGDFFFLSVASERRMELSLSERLSLYHDDCCSFAANVLFFPLVLR